MKPGDKVIRIKRGKYRYRGHIIWTDDVLLYWCSPDPSSLPTWDRTLRGIVDYIDKWEAAFEENRVNGNLILMSEETAQELLKTITEHYRKQAELAKATAEDLMRVAEKLNGLRI